VILSALIFKKKHLSMFMDMAMSKCHTPIATLTITQLRMAIHYRKRRVSRSEWHDYPNEALREGERNNLLNR
jgi:hypothetical protein